MNSNRSRLSRYACDMAVSPQRRAFIATIESNVCASILSAKLAKFDMLASSWPSTIPQRAEILTVCSCTLGAMRDELSGLGIVLDTSGPGQYLPIIEQKIQTVEERLRAHVHNLPFVMTKLLLTMSVLFCVSRINMPSRMSGTRTSPIEQFTGMKFNAARDL